MMDNLLRFFTYHRLMAIFVLLVTQFFNIQLSQAAGLMTPASGALPALNIKSHHVNVVIEDGYAITRIDQEFTNPHGQDLEAVYSFPVPEKASVGEFTYWIDGKPITAEVLENKKARQVYEQEKAKGRETALTEKNSYRTFEVSVYPVRSQQQVKIRLVYIQPVHIDTSMGRYVYPLEEGGVDEQSLAFWSYNEAVEEAFSFNVTLRSSYPVDGVRLPQHPQASVASQSALTWTASLGSQQPTTSNIDTDALLQPASAVANSQTQPIRLDKDIIVYWRLQQGLPGNVAMVSHKEANKNRGTFMMTVTPSDDLAVINEGRDWVFVLDLSGSMQGKYQSLVEGVKQGLHKMNSKDRFRIVLFNNQAKEITSGYLPATTTQVTRAIQTLEGTQPSGGTNLYAGLSEGIKKLDSDRSSAVVLVTDGVANVGTTEKKAFLRLLEKHDVRLFTLVMGNSANRPLLESMTKVSNGFAMNVSNSDDIVGNILLATNKLTHEAMHDVHVSIRGIKVKEVTPARIGSVYRGQQLIIFGHYWGQGVADVEITGKVSGQKKVYKTQFNFPKQATLNPEIERLWAYASIEELQNEMDYLGQEAADSKQAIVDIAKEYGLVTDYTSMLVVREQAFTEHNIQRSNQQRVQKEQATRQQRASTPAKVNTPSKQPAFSTPRAYPKSGGSAGGAIGPWILMLLLPLWMARRKKCDQ